MGVMYQAFVGMLFASLVSTVAALGHNCDCEWTEVTQPPSCRTKMEVKALSTPHGKAKMVCSALTSETACASGNTCTWMMDVVSQKETCMSPLEALVQNKELTLVKAACAKHRTSTECPSIVYIDQSDDPFPCVWGHGMCMTQDMLDKMDAPEAKAHDACLALTSADECAIGKPHTCETSTYKDYMASEPKASSTVSDAESTAAEEQAESSPESTAAEMQADDDDHLHQTQAEANPATYMGAKCVVALVV